MNLQQFNNIEVSDPFRVNNLVTNVVNKHVKHEFTTQHLVVTVHSKEPVLYRIPIGVLTTKQMSDMNRLSIH